MLIRWLFWIFLAWYIYRTVGRLLGLTFGKKETHERVPESGRSVFTVTQARRPDQTQDEETVLRSDVEDAKWKDV